MAHQEDISQCGGRPAEKCNGGASATGRADAEAVVVIGEGGEWQWCRLLRGTWEGAQ